MPNRSRPSCGLTMGLFCSSLPQLDPSQLSSAAPHRYLRGRSREGRVGTCGSFQQLPTAFANGWMRGSMNCMPNSDGSLRTSPPSRAPRYGRAASRRRGHRWCRCCRCMPNLWVKSPAQHGAVPTILCSRSAHLAGLAWPLQLRGRAEQAQPSRVLAGRLSIGWLLDRPARHLRHDCLWRQSIARTRLDLVHDSAHHGSHIRRPIPSLKRLISRFNIDIHRPIRGMLATFNL